MKKEKRTKCAFSKQPTDRRRTANTTYDFDCQKPLLPLSFLFVFGLLVAHFFRLIVAVFGFRGLWFATFLLFAFGVRLLLAVAIRVIAIGLRGGFGLRPVVMLLWRALMALA
jgi:hypothetical protein